MLDFFFSIPIAGSRMVSETLIGPEAELLSQFNFFEFPSHFAMNIQLHYSCHGAINKLKM